MKRKFVKLKLKFVFKLKLNIEIGFLIQIVRHEICAHKNVIRYARRKLCKNEEQYECRYCYSYTYITKIIKKTNNPNDVSKLTM